MSEGIGVVGLYVHDQDEALDFYVGKLGFQVHTDARNGNHRWLTVKHPKQPTFERAKGVEFIQEPIARFGGVDANFRDPSGNAWKMIQARS